MQIELRITFGASDSPILDALRIYQGHEHHRSMAESIRRILRESLLDKGYLNPGRTPWNAEQGPISTPSQRETGESA